MKIIKIIFLTQLIFLSVQSVKSQNWVWSNQLACDGDVEIYDLISDNSNNVYLAGNYNNSTLQIGSDTIHNIGGSDGFICKFNPQGELQWLKRIGGSDNDEVVTLSLIGSNLYVAGSYKSSILRFTGSDLLVNNGGWDAFIARFNLNGVFQDAARIFWGSDNQRIRDMLYDENRNQFVIIGNLKSFLVYDNGIENDTVIARGPKDLFIAQSNISSEVSKIVNYETSTNKTVFKDITISQNTGYFMSGDLKGKVFFTPTDSLAGDEVNMDIMCFRVDTGLTLNWKRKAGGTSWDHANSSVSDIYGNIYLTGQLQGDVYFDSTATQSIFIPNLGNEDIYLAKFNKSGNLQWIRRKGDTGKDDGYGLVQRENLVQFCGNFAGTVIFNVDTLKSSSTLDRNTGFAIFDTYGNEVGAKDIGGTLEDRGTNIAFTPEGNTVIAGYYLSPTINIGDSSYVNGSGTSNGFIGEYYYPMKVVFKYVKNVSCNGGNDGELIATPFFGMEDYTYEWSPNVTVSDDSVAHFLSAGIYSVTITDNRDSTASNTIQITEPLAISITLDSTNLSCYQSGDGAIDIEVTEGTGGYTYNWTGGSGLNPTGSDQSNLYAGLYKVTVTDDNGCKSYDSTTVTEPDPITYAGTDITPAYSADSCSGTIDLEVQGGTPLYTYEWEKGGVSMAGRTSDTLNNLCGDTYKVIVTDSHHCTDDTTIVITALDELIIYIDSVAHVSCFGYNNGYARIGISGDKGFDYTYTWEDFSGSPVGTDTNYIANVSGGMYYITVTENGGDNRADSTSVEIEEPLLLATQIDSSPPLCYGDANGSINLSVSGGKPVYTYHWSTGQSSEDLNNLTGSIEYYRVTVTDKNGCTVMDSVLLEVPEQLNVSITVLQEIRCNGELTGTLRANNSGGTGSIDYLWDDPGSQATQIATGLAASNYTVTVKDENGCQNTASEILDDPDAISIIRIDTIHVSCVGLSDGSILITPGGGTEPYKYTWDRVPVDTNYINNLSSMFGGLYSVSVTDAYECPPAEATIQISEPSVALNITENTASHEDNLCYGDNNGEMEAIAEGGWGVYEYSLNSINWDAGTLFSGLAQGNYYVKVRDSLQCVDSVLIHITQPAEVVVQEVTASHENVLCFNAGTGQLEVTASGGTPGYEYSIDKLVWNANAVFENLAAADYNIWARDTNGCFDSVPVTITQTAAINLQEIAGSHENVPCYGDSTGQIQVYAAGGTPGYEYSDDKSAWNISSVFEDLSPEVHTIWVRDANECLDSADFTITQPEKIIIDPVVSNDTLQVEATGGTAPIQYSLDGGGLVITGFFTGLVEGEHTILVIDDNSCTADTIVLVELIPVVPDTTMPVTLYDAFSPNGDGKNEVWNIGNINEFPDCVVKIYNTWGKLVFTSDGYPEPWDGKNNGKDLPAGTYFYIINLGGENETYTGSVNIVK